MKKICLLVFIMIFSTLNVFADEISYSNLKKCANVYGEPAVCGYVQNNSGYMKKIVLVNIDIYDASGKKLFVQAVDNIEMLKAGEKRKFCAPSVSKFSTWGDVHIKTMP